MAQKNINSLVVYRLSPEKNKDLLKRSVQSCGSALSSDTNAHKKRYLVSQKSGLIYEILQKSQLNGVLVKQELTEPESDLISDDEYFKYLGLIHTKRLNTQTTHSLNQWPLRNISKVESNPKTDRNGNILLTDICPKPMSTETEMNCDLSENSCEVSRRKLAKHQWKEEVLDSTKRLVPQKESNKPNDELSRKREKELRDARREQLFLISCFDLSSLLGKRIFGSLFDRLTDLEKYLTLIRFENYCLCDFVQQLSAINTNFGSNCVSRMTRAKDGSDWNPRHYQHKYCFNRMQRLEKYRQLETGLNWRSRLLKSRCKRVSIKLNQIKKCPLCSKTIEFQPKHQCFEFEPHLKPQNNTPKDSSNEVIIIGDDFMDEDMNNEESAKSAANNCSKEEVIKANDDEDDDLMIIEEVIVKPKAKPNNSVLKLLLKAQMGPKPIGSTNSTSLMSCTQLRPIRVSNESSNCETIICSTSVTKNVNFSKQNNSNERDFVFTSNLF